MSTGNHHLSEDLDHTINNSKAKSKTYESIHQVMKISDYIDDILTKIGFGYFQVIAFCLAGMSYIALTNEVLTFAFISIEVTKLWKFNAIVFSSVFAATCVTNVVGEISAGYVADRYGRIWPYAIFLAIIAFLVVASAFAPNFIIFVILRGLASIGVGGISVLIHPTLIEFLPVKNRGKITVLTGVIQAIGSCMVGGLAWWLVPRYGTHGWRYFIIATAVPSFIALVFRLAFYVKSPRYLLSHNKVEDAWKVFSLMAFINGKDVNSIVKKQEFLLKAGKINDDFPKDPLLKRFYSILQPPYLRRTVLLLVVFSIQFSTYYGSTIFLPYNLQILGVDPYFVSFVGFLAQIPGTCLMAIIVEWPLVGRRNSFRLFTALTAIFFFLFAFFRNEVATPVLTVLVYFSMTPNISLLLTYITESFPTEIRVTVISLISAVAAVNGIWIPFVSGYLADLSKHFPWLPATIWGCMYLFQFIVSLFLNHETQGRNLHDILIN